MSGDTVSRPKRMATRSSKQQSNNHCKNKGRKSNPTNQRQECHQEEAVSSTTVIVNDSVTTSEEIHSEMIQVKREEAEDKATSTRIETSSVIVRRMSLTESDEEAISSVMDSSVVSNILEDLDTGDMDVDMDSDDLMLSDRSLMASFTSLVESSASSSASSPPMTRSGSLTIVRPNEVMKIKVEEKEEETVSEVEKTTPVVTSVIIQNIKQEPEDECSKDTQNPQGKQIKEELLSQPIPITTISGHTQKVRTGKATATPSAKVNNVSSSKNAANNSSPSSKSGAKSKASTSSKADKGEFLYTFTFEFFSKTESLEDSMSLNIRRL
jgi:hypothetical protein